MKAGDLELLELAAKAAGLDLDWSGPGSPWLMTGEGDDYGPADQWNPLWNDGDAFRLMVDLKIGVFFDSETTDAFVAGERYDGLMVLPTSGDPLADARRLIVEAAAELARLEQ